MALKVKTAKTQRSEVTWSLAGAEAVEALPLVPEVAVVGLSTQQHPEVARPGRGMRVAGVTGLSSARHPGKPCTAAVVAVVAQARLAPRAAIQQATVRGVAVLVAWALTCSASAGITGRYLACPASLVAAVAAAEAATWSALAAVAMGALAASGAVETAKPRPCRGKGRLMAPQTRAGVPERGLQLAAAASSLFVGW